MSINHTLNRLLCLFGLLLFANPSEATAQRDTLAGLWEGVLTIEKDGKISSEYTVFFNFSEENDSISGISNIIYKDKSAKLFFQAELKTPEILEIKETEIIRADVLPNGEWCIKNIVLHRFFENNQLVWRGEWSGKTSFSNCSPGKIYLKRSIKRA